MRTLLHLKPRQKGTKHRLAQYGDSPVCVRYRYDVQRKKRSKTVELTVTQRACHPPAMRPSRLRGRCGDAATVKQVGARWNPSSKALELRHAQLVASKLEARTVEEAASYTGCRG